MTNLKQATIEYGEKIINHISNIREEEFNSTSYIVFDFMGNTISVPLLENINIRELLMTDERHLKNFILFHYFKEILNIIKSKNIKFKDL